MDCMRPKMDGIKVELINGGWRQHHTPSGLYEMVCDRQVGRLICSVSDTIVENTIGTPTSRSVLARSWSRSYWIPDTRTPGYRILRSLHTMSSFFILFHTHNNLVVGKRL